MSQLINEQDNISLNYEEHQDNIRNIKETYGYVALDFEQEMEKLELSNLKFHPNPNSGKFTLEFETTETKFIFNELRKI